MREPPNLICVCLRDHSGAEFKRSRGKGVTIEQTMLLPLLGQNRSTVSSNKPIMATDKTEQGAEDRGGFCVATLGERHREGHPGISKSTFGVLT